VAVSISLPVIAQSLAIARISAFWGVVEMLYSTRVPDKSKADAKPCKKLGAANKKPVSSPYLLILINPFVL
jgi:hypothetical protein